MVCLIPDRGLYVGFDQSICLATEIDSLIKNGFISFDDYPYLVEFSKTVYNAFHSLD